MGHELRFERVFNATPAQVFDVFTSPAGQDAMFRASPEWIVESDLDLREGGVWEVASGPSRDELYRFTHVFTKVERPRSISFRVSERGPGGPVFDSDAEVTFEGRDGMTHMTYLQTFPNPELRDAHQGGLGSAFERLDGLIRTDVGDGREGSSRG